MKRKTTFAVLAAAGLAAGCATAGGGMATAPDGSVTIPVQVDAGDAYLMEGTVEISTAAANETFTAVLDYQMALEVVEDGPDGQTEGGVWRWSIERFGVRSFDGPGLSELPRGAMDAVTSQAMSDVISATARLLTDIDFECRVDAHGACVEMTNWHEWRERVENVGIIGAGVVELVPAFGGPAAVGEGGPTMDKVAAAIRNATGVLLDGFDPATAAVLMTTPQITSFQGQTLVPGVATAQEDVYPLPFGTDALTIPATVTLVEVDRAAGVARFTRTSDMAGEALGEAIASLVQNATPPLMTAIAPVLPPGEADAEEMAAFMSAMVAGMVSAFDFRIAEESTADVDLTTGLVRSGRSHIVQSIEGPGGETFGDTTTTLTFGFREGAPQRPLLGGQASAED